MTDTVITPVPGQFLLDRVSHGVRRQLVKSRILAMEGSIEDALQSLNNSIETVGNSRPRDTVVLGLLKAELLHLDLRHEEARAVIEKVVSPHLAELMAEERFGVEQNLSDLQFYTGNFGTALYYNVVDQKRLLDFEWLDYRELFTSKQDADRGKHYETLPILWQQHRRAYSHVCWVAQKWTNQLLANESVQLKSWQDAVHHAILACDETSLDGIIEGVLSTRNVELIERVVKRLLTTANLKMHFVVACKIIKGVADAIPDSLILPVGEWLLKRAKDDIRVRIGTDYVALAWETIAAVASRFGIELAKSTIQVAVQHPIWNTKFSDPNRVIPARKEAVRALEGLVQSIDVDDISQLADSALQLMIDRPQVTDYDDVVNLLCHLAVHGGKTVRDKLALSLYPVGQPVSRVLASVATYFDKGELFDSIRLQNFATQIEQEIYRQVQWVAQDQIAEPVNEQLFTFNCSPKSDRTLVVYAVGLTGLHAIIQHRAKLDESTLGKLIVAILDMAQNKDNFCSNRAALLQALTAMVDVIPASARTKCVEVLEQIARGPVEESSEYNTAAETDNPMNRFKYRFGRPDDVQSAALVALAMVAAGQSSAIKRVVDILDESLCDHRPGIRRASYAAAWRLPDVSEGVILGVLAGLRDPDPNVAESAFAALANQPNWKLNRNHWRVLLMATRLAQSTGSSKLRRVAATALVAKSSKCPPQHANELAELLKAFGDDICWSVRNITTRPVSEEKRSLS